MPRRFYAPYFNPIEQAGDATFAITIALQIDAQIMRDRLTAQLSIVVGGLAALLACIGLYGVVSYSVPQRTRELGIRMALGARRHTVLGLVLREALLVTLLGVTVASIAVTRIAQSLLLGLTARDPATMAGLRWRSWSWRRARQPYPHGAPRPSTRWWPYAANSEGPATDFEWCTIRLCEANY
jgi:ABC-type antimicrobial peptide transport system permease subunit